MARELAGKLPGKLYGLGVGPGDPELITVKALRLLQSAHVVAYPTGRSEGGNAIDIVERYLKPEQIRLAMIYPATAGPVADSAAYPGLMSGYYDDTSDEVATHLEAGRDVAIICQGDPFFYGSYMYWHARLAERFETTVVPGISSVMAGPVQLGRPLCHRNDVVSVIPATAPEEVIEARLKLPGSAVIMKLGRTLPKIKRVLERIGRLQGAYLVERATMSGERIISLAEIGDEKPGYFSIIVIPCETPR